MAEAGRVRAPAVELPSSPGGGDPAGLYAAGLRARFEDAAGAVGETAAELELGELRLRLRFAGEPMRAALLPPFEHLGGAGAGEPELTVSVFDAASTGIAPPPRAWPEPEPVPGGSPAVLMRSERACVLASTATGAITAAEPGAGLAVFHLPDAGRIPAAERAAPLREALQLLMAPRRRWMTHAAAVGRGGRGVLLVGRGGSGKSTLALACALAGMEIVADDYVLLEDEGPFAHAMQSTAKLTRHSARLLGLDAGLGFEPTLEGPAKALLDIRDLAPGMLRRRLQIAAIVAPSVADLDSPRLTPVSPAAGLRALAPSTILQSHSRGTASLPILASVARRVPSYGLDLCPDPAANAAAIERLVGELG